MILVILVIISLTYVRVYRRCIGDINDLVTPLNECCSLCKDFLGACSE